MRAPGARWAPRSRAPSPSALTRRLRRRHRSTGGDTGSTGGYTNPPGGDTDPSDGQQTTAYKYVVDVTFTANGRSRRIRGLEKLDMLPNQAAPYLIFMGVTPKGSTRCSWSTRASPRRVRAAAAQRQGVRVRLHRRGLEHVFNNEDGDTYTVRIDEIRKVKIGASSSGRATSAARAPRRRSARTAVRRRCSLDLSWWPVTASMTQTATPTVDRENQCDASPSSASRWSRRLSGSCRARRAPPPALARCGFHADHHPCNADARARGCPAHDPWTQLQGHEKTVIFRAPDGRTAFAKPRRASRTRLVVAVPPAVARLVKLGKGHPLQAACAGRQVQSLHHARLSRSSSRPRC